MEDVALHDSFTTTDPATCSLRAGELHLWAVPLTGPPAGLVSLLSRAERDRAARFHFADHRRRFEIGHGALRRILAGYLGSDPRQLEFGVGGRGKPFLSMDRDGVPGLHFNLSHSGSLTLIGVSASEVGIDGEKMRRLASYLKIAEKQFSPAEFALLRRVPEEQRLAAFYRCWTRKEAYVKALGEGLSMSLDSFEVSLDDRPCLIRSRAGTGDPNEWSILDLSPGPGYVAAGALRLPEVEVRRFRLDRSG